MERDTIFNIRSMTKPLTGAAAQILIDHGLLSLDDPVAQYVPGFDNDDAREVTVRQLLTHQSGLPVSVMTLFSDYEDLLAVANEAGKRGPYFEPEEKFWYSDAGTDTLGAVVAQASGKLLDELVREELLEPLGMGDSRWLHEEEPVEANRFASLYSGRPGSWKRFWKGGDDFLYEYAWGSQSLYSTAKDYARFLAMWMDGGAVGERRILSAEAVERTLTPVCVITNIGSDTPYPTGFEGLVPHYGQMAMLYVDPKAPDDARPVAIGHGGSDGTIAWAWPELDLIILAFTQSRGGPAVLLLEPYIDYLLIHPERQAESRAHLERYLGVWSPNPDDEDPREFELLIQNGHLAVDIEGKRFAYELLGPDEEGRWSFWLDPSLAFSFETTDAGEIERMLLLQPDGNQTALVRIDETTPGR